MRRSRRHRARRPPGGGRALVAALAVPALLAIAGCSGGGDATAGDSGGGAGGSGGGQLTVLAASSLTEPLTEYAEQFAGAEAKPSFAGSDELAAQIRQGAEADVFAAADTEYPAALHAEGLAAEPVVFAANELVIAVPAGGAVRSLADLARPGVKLVIGDPGVPVGAYARAVLDRLPAAEREAILANVRSEETAAGSVVAKLEAGAADAGFVYATDQRAASGLDAVPLPPRLRPEIAYAAAVLSAGENRAAAERFLDGLVRGRGQARLRAAGFLPPP